MKIKLLLFWFLLILNSNCAAEAEYRPKSYYDQLAHSGMHDAGFFALNFGPAILSSWKSAVYMEYSVPNDGPIEPTVFPKKEDTKIQTVFKRYQIVENDKDIDSVRSWLQEHLCDRINLSPDTPASGAFAFRFSYILLFSSAIPPDCTWEDGGQPILAERLGTFKNQALNKALLLGIPCTTQVFGWSADKERHDLEALKSLMHYAGKVLSDNTFQQPNP